MNQGGQDMKYRLLGKTGVKVSEISLGTWQLGSIWGMPFDYDKAIETLEIAEKEGVNCFDTADVYIDGVSENTIGKFKKQRNSNTYVITKVGRKLQPHIASLYNEKNLRKFVDDSRKNLDLDTLNMVLLHCPPAEVYENNRVFKIMDQLVAEKKVLHYGVSVETISEALFALTHPNVSAIEIIFNMFRLKPAEKLFEKAKEKNVGLIIRVSLASGLLTGKYHEKTSFNPNDHRTYNRHGEAFDKGETFSGVDYHLGLKAVTELKKLFGTDNLVPYALRWILMFDAVSTVIPGASNPKQIEMNVKASELPPLTKKQMDGVKHIYDTYIKSSVHHLW